MKILITGISGLLGGALIKEFADEKLVGIWHTRIPPEKETPTRRFIQADLTDPAALTRILNDETPDAVIHAAALARVDECENDPEAARRINTECTGNIAAYCASKETSMLFVSTDLVFAGDRGGYSEEDIPDGQGVYARTKIQGETAVLKLASANLYVMRSALMYGEAHGKRESFLGWMDRSFQQKKPLGLFYDEFRTPALASDNARLCRLIIQKRPQKRIFHGCGPVRLSRYDFGKLFAEVRGYDPGLIIRASRNENPMLHSRGRDCSLMNSKTVLETGFSPSKPREGLMKLAERPITGS